jgi:hypothetical protein
MGECGCISCGKTYKLQAPDGGWYVFQMLPGCDYCSVGPTIHISMPQTSKLYYEEELEHIPTIPTIVSGKEVVAVIKCGIPPDQAANLAVKTMVGSETENNKIDEYLAEVLGEDFWREAMQQAPDFVQLT